LTAPQSHACYAHWLDYHCQPASQSSELRLLWVLLILNVLIKTELLNRIVTAPCAPDGALGSLLLACKKASSFSPVF